MTRLIMERPSERQSLFMRAREKYSSGYISPACMALA